MSSAVDRNHVSHRPIDLQIVMGLVSLGGVGVLLTPLHRYGSAWRNANRGIKTYAIAGREGSTVSAVS